MKVRDVMNVKPVTVQAEAFVSEAARLLRENKISGMPVLDGENWWGCIGIGPFAPFICGREGRRSLASQPLRGLRDSIP